MKTKEEIMNMIQEEGVEFIRLQFTDMFGNLKNLAVTPSQMERVLDNKYVFDGAAMVGNTRVCEEDMYLRPDFDTFVILPWRPQQGKVGKVLCDVCNEDGTVHPLSPRTILKTVLNDAEKKGYTFYVDPECEFFLFHTDENNMPTTVTHELAGYMDVCPVDLGENARRDMVLALEDMGFEVESSHHEKAPAQHEIDFQEGEALKTADDITTFKFAVRSIAKRFGLYATFMPKPKSNVPGSGMHLNLAAYKDGKNVFQARGGSDETTDEARWFIGGIFKHINAICAITNPIVNSYKRIVTGFEAPMDVVWTTGSGNSLIKVNKKFKEETKLELRFPDPSANQYLALAVCIAAGIDGIENKIEPGKESYLAGSLVGDKNSDVAADVAKLPDCLKVALNNLREDEFVKGVLGKDFSEIYIEEKEKEWDEYLKQVTDWEVNHYLYRL